LCPVLAGTVYFDGRWTTVPAGGVDEVPVVVFEKIFSGLRVAARDNLHALDQYILPKSDGGTHLLRFLKQGAL
jgi:hypothetical protein